MDPDCLCLIRARPFAEYFHTGRAAWKVTASVVFQNTLKQSKKAKPWHIVAIHLCQLTTIDNVVTVRAKGDLSGPQLRPTFVQAIQCIYLLCWFPQGDWLVTRRVIQ